MAFPASCYIDQQDGALRIAGTRAVAFFRSHSLSRRPWTLAQVSGAIAHYLDNQKLIDDYFAEVDREFERLVPPLSQSNPEPFARLQAAREKVASKGT